MSFHALDDPLPLNTTLVAVDKDKNSSCAVRWAIHHLNHPLLVLFHARSKSNQHQGSNDDEVEGKQIFAPFRGICARNGVQVKEVIVEDNDVSRALLDYVSKNCIYVVVVGASTRGAFARKFKGSDVPTTITKSAPDFCTVYVISKGKIHSARQALRPVANTPLPPKQSAASRDVSPDYSLQNGGREHSHRDQRRRETDKLSSERNSDPRRSPMHEKARNSTGSVSLDNDVLNLGTRLSDGHNSVSDDNDFPGSLMFASMDVKNLDFSMAGDPSPPGSNSNNRDVEAEMKRLKLELKQTMDMYNTACKQALSAKNQAKELSQWRLEEERKFEEARQAEEAALAIAEREKARCKAALEAAEEAQRMAEKEAQRRKYAELKAKREAEERSRVVSSLTNNDYRYRRYSIEDIEAATQNFSESMKIGEGGYGPVFKGKLDHTPVAIKVLRPDAAQGRKQFQQEVEVLCTIRHPNMVLLLGACPEYGCLVYEYMSHGSLEDRLMRKGNSPPLSWRRRFKIAAEIATSLLFLHQSKPEPLVHRDLKPANILLDQNYVSKISDVGLARLVPQSVADSVTQYHMTSAAGTFCYIDPEYQQTGMLTTKSDIYSLGIMLLQIITAKSPMGIAHHVKKAIEKEKIAEVLDPAVTDWPIEEALVFAKLALKCAELRKRDRPDLDKVIVPELNRLRNLGKTTDQHSSHKHGGGSSSSSNHSNSQQYNSQVRPPTPTRTPHAKMSRATQSCDNNQSY